MTIYQLKHEATATAIFRKHTLGPWTHHLDSQQADATCKKCGAWVQVNTKPAPNQIGMGGPAIALNCK